MRVFIIGQWTADDFIIHAATVDPKKVDPLIAQIKSKLVGSLWYVPDSIELEVKAVKLTI